jgi:hypothetical protein
VNAPIELVFSVWQRKKLLATLKREFTDDLGQKEVNVLPKKRESANKVVRIRRNPSGVSKRGQIGCALRELPVKRSSIPRLSVANPPVSAAKTP